MSLTVTIPYRDTAQDAVECQYFAINNPLVIRCERKDFAIVDTQDDGAGNTQINITGSLPALTVGGTIFVNAGTFTLGLCGNFTVLSNTASAVVIDEPFTSGLLLGYINLLTDRANYYVYTRMNTPAIVGQFGDTPFIYRKDRPDNLGVLNMDVHENMFTGFTRLNESDYQSIRYNDENNLNNYIIAFLEVWDGSAEIWSAQQNIYAVNAAMQIQHTGGSNMSDYMTTAAANHKAKFLSGSTRLRYWTDFPFDLSFLLSPDVIAGLYAGTLARHEVEYQGSTVGAVADINLPVVSIFDDGIQRITLTGSYAPTTDRVNVSIIYNNFPTIYTNLTEEVQVRVTDCTPKNQVYLAWLDKTGGWNYFLFSIKQIKGRKTAISGVFSKFFTDMETQETTATIIDKTVDPHITCGAEQLDAYDDNLMRSLIDSPYVLLLMNNDDWDTDGPQWQEVRVEPSDYKYEDTKKVYQNIELKILLPEVYVQKN